MIQVPNLPNVYIFSSKRDHVPLVQDHLAECEGCEGDEGYGKVGAM